MLQIRIEIIVLLCDIVLAGSGVALLATGCQSQRGGASPSAPPPKYATGTDGDAVWVRLWTWVGRKKHVTDLILT